MNLTSRNISVIYDDVVANVVTRKSKDMLLVVNNEIKPIIVTAVRNQYGTDLTDITIIGVVVTDHPNAIVCVKYPNLFIEGYLSDEYDDVIDYYRSKQVDVYITHSPDGIVFTICHNVETKSMFVYVCRNVMGWAPGIITHDPHNVIHH